jgi:hypothetical protein
MCQKPASLIDCKIVYKSIKYQLLLHEKSNMSINIFNIGYFLSWFIRIALCSFPEDFPHPLQQIVCFKRLFDIINRPRFLRVLYVFGIA